MQRMYTAVYKKTRTGYVAWVEEVPGINTQGKTKAETLKNLRDAARLFVAARRSLSKTSHGGSVVRERFSIS